jgi:hypothetical protein
MNENTTTRHLTGATGPHAVKCRLPAENGPFITKPFWSVRNAVQAVRKEVCRFDRALYITKCLPM